MDLKVTAHTSASAEDSTCCIGSSAVEGLQLGAAAKGGSTPLNTSRALQGAGPQGDWPSRKHKGHHADNPAAHRSF